MTRLGAITLAGGRYGVTTGLAPKSSEPASKVMLKATAGWEMGNSLFQTVLSGPFVLGAWGPTSTSHLPCQPPLDDPGNENDSLPTLHNQPAWVSNCPSPSESLANQLHPLARRALAPAAV